MARYQADKDLYFRIVLDFTTAGFRPLPVYPWQKCSLDPEARCKSSARTLPMLERLPAWP
jgi:hypothetical protein